MSNIIPFTVATVAMCIIVGVPFPTAAAPGASARRSSPFLISERPARRPARQSECLFDQKTYDIGATWFPDFGPPTGINYCYRCECVSHTKRRRVTAKATCTNIRDQCPKPKCSKPVQMPGRCCRVCPGMEEPADNPDLQLDTAQPDEPETNSTAYYGVLLTGRTSAFLRHESIKAIYSTNNPKNIAATGRFTYTQKNLYYSFYVPAKSAKPRIVQFIDAAGLILQEHSLVVPVNGPLSDYQQSTGKTCGVWRRMTADARKLLRDNQIRVVLLWGGPNQAELALAGRVSNYTALPTEHFSALLEAAPGTKPEHMRGSGGTAFVWTHATGPTAVINMTVVFNGVFGARDIADVGVQVRLESINGTQVMSNQSFVLEKPAPDYNEVQFTANISMYDLRQLAAGKLYVIVESKRNRKLRIRGPVKTRVSCEHFQNVLTAEPGDRSARSSGLAWMYVNGNGDLVYNVQTDGVETRSAPVPVLTIADEANRLRPMRLESLSRRSSNVTSVGVLETFGPRYIETLYAGGLIVNVASKGITSVRGRMVAHQMADARDTVEPVLLRRLNATRPADLVGMVWLAVDNQCSLRFEVTLNAQRINRTYQLYLVDVPFQAPGAPIKRRQLATWHGPQLDGAQMGVTSADLLRLETHVTHLIVQSKGKPLLRGRLRKVKIPTHCEALPDDSKHDGSMNTQSTEVIKKPCFESKRFHKDGEQWQSEAKSCTMCSCLHGEVQCEAMLCPPLLCVAAERVMLPNACCATCAAPTNVTILAEPAKESESAAVPATGPATSGRNTLTTSSSRGCWLSKQFHQAGSTFHPYLPPNSYDTCLICTCDPLTLTVSCPRVQCPQLTCSDRIAFRADKKACCKQCPAEELTVDQELMHDQAAVPEPVPQALSAKVVVAANTTNSLLHKEGGGCVVGANIYANGQEWHPQFSSGVKRCVLCRCLNSRAECETPHKCTKSVCERLAQRREVQTKSNDAIGQNNSLAEKDECCVDVCRQQTEYIRI